MLELLEASSEYASTDLRRCSRCGELKPTDDFPIKNKVTGLRSVWCRSCRRAYGKEHYERNRPTYLARANHRRSVERPRTRAKIDEYLRAHPCVDCGCSEITVLEFDHRDPSAKEVTVGALARMAEWPRVLREIEKCDVRCANCHRRRTASQFRWAKVSGVVITTPIRPGQSGRYALLATPSQDPLLSPSPTGLRRCSRCRELKAVSEFAFRDLRAGKRDYYCRPCRHAYRRGHYERNKPDYIARAMVQMRMKREDALVAVHAYLREHPCVDCGETNIITLEFDHRDPRTKVMDVGAMFGRRSWSAILAEIAKCDVVCANCHRKRTAKQQGWKVRLAERRGVYARMRSAAGVA